MNKNNNLKIAAAVSVFSLMTACSSAPKGQQLSADTDVNQALEQTQAELDQARANNMDVLAPKNFAKAEDALKDARRDVVKGNSKDKTLKDLSEAKAWLAEVHTKGDIVNAAAKGLPEARTGAMKAEANKYYPKEFAKLEKETLDVSEDAEKGDLSKLTKESDDLSAKYHELEVRSVTKAKLGGAESNIAQAKKWGAEKKAPQTWQAANAKYNAANQLIVANPRNTAAIDAAAAEATDESQFLMNVTQKVKQGNTEALVLQTENQNRRLQGMAARNQQTQAQLAQKSADLQAAGSALDQQKAILATAEKLRSQLKPNEAEVFVEGNNVKVRLKGVQFASSKATLNRKSSDLLQKVDKALNSIGGVNAITVEGHTDNVGAEDKNKEISQKRAEAVENYLVTKGQQSKDKIKAVGMGEETPVADNKTPYGRAQNRRIDLVIEPAVASNAGNMNEGSGSSTTGGTSSQGTSNQSPSNGSTNQNNGSSNQ
jgi:outer membrane protein OmpA-like peptidoglycan-associated protein